MTPVAFSPGIKTLDLRAPMSTAKEKKKKKKRSRAYKSLYEHMRCNIRSQKVRMCYHVYKNIVTCVDISNFYNHPTVKKLGIVQVAPPGAEFTRNFCSIDSLYCEWAAATELKFLREERKFDSRAGEKK